MSELEQGRSSQEDGQTGLRSNVADTWGSTRCNEFTGIVISERKGLTRTTLRIRVGERTDLRVRWSAASESEDAVDIGHPVGLTIPEPAVQLEAGGFRRGKQRWNRWIGRVVLVDRNNDDPVITIKVYRDDITLKSRGPVIGAHRPLAAWDTVNVVVDPQRVSLTPMNLSSPRTANTSSQSLACSHPASVWLRAIIRAVRWSPIGQHVALDVGGVKLSALVEADREAMQDWRVGNPAEINISSCQAWIRLNSRSPLRRCCVVLSSQVEESQRSALRPTQGEL